MMGPGRASARPGGSTQAPGSTLAPSSPLPASSVGRARGRALLQATQSPSRRLGRRGRARSRGVRGKRRAYASDRRALGHIEARAAIGRYRRRSERIRASAVLVRRALGPRTRATGRQARPARPARRPPPCEPSGSTRPGPSGSTARRAAGCAPEPSPRTVRPIGRRTSRLTRPTGRDVSVQGFAEEGGIVCEGLSCSWCSG
jgi:hypothetical protein